MKKNITIFLLVAMCLLCSAGYSQTTTREERIYALSQLWKELQYNFAFPERLQNIDSLYISYLPKIEKAEGIEYYLTLQSFMAHFNDAHTRISAPTFGYPQLTPKVFGEKVVVWNMPKSKKEAMPRGSEIIRINSISTQRYLQDSVYPYISAATAPSRLAQALYPMLRGPAQSEIKLTIKTPTGKIADVQLMRFLFSKQSYSEDWAFPDDFSPLTIKVVDKNIGYIALNTCSARYLDLIESVFHQNLPVLRQCKGLIIDLRYNGGGTDEAWHTMADYLILSSRYTAGKNLSRAHVAAYKAWGVDYCDEAISALIGTEFDANNKYCDYYKGLVMQEHEEHEYVNTLSDSLKLKQPLVVLMGRATASAAESFVLALKEAGRGILVGEASASNLGNTLFVKLPGNTIARIGANKTTLMNGGEFNTTGILPDIAITEDLETFLRGEDNVLSKGVEELQQLIEYNVAR